jgi:hypothetical protein
MLARAVLVFGFTSTAPPGSGSDINWETVSIKQWKRYE